MYFTEAQVSKFFVSSNIELKALHYENIVSKVSYFRQHSILCSEKKRKLEKSFIKKHRFSTVQHCVHYTFHFADIFFNELLG